MVTRPHTTVVQQSVGKLGCSLQYGLALEGKKSHIQNMALSLKRFEVKKKEYRKLAQM